MTRTGVAALAAGLMLAGCATAPPVPEEPWAERADRLAAVSAWRAEGRLAVRAGDEGFSGGFVWRETPFHTDIRFSGPLGIGAVSVAGPPGALVIADGDGERLVLTDPEPELETALGYPMPVESLPRWMLGLPDAGYDYTYALDEAGLLAALDQRGWRIEYRSWREQAGEILPRRVDLARDGLEIRLVLDEWTALP